VKEATTAARRIAMNANRRGEGAWFTPYRSCQSVTQDATPATQLYLNLRVLYSMRMNSLLIACVALAAMSLSALGFEGVFEYVYPAVTPPPGANEELKRMMAETPKLMYELIVFSANGQVTWTQHGAKTMATFTQEGKFLLVLEEFGDGTRSFSPFYLHDSQTLYGNGKSYKPVKK
jgi:hypothetical protein